MESVRLRAKSVLIIGVILAILYVLISPLPEMAATQSGGCLIFLASSLLGFVLALIDPPIAFVGGLQSGVGIGLSRSLLCTRLC